MRLRALFREPDTEVRSQAHRSLVAMTDLELSSAAVPVVLASATLTYPVLVDDRSDPAALVLDLLHRRPQMASVSDVESTYLLGSVTVRRALLEVLARRGDPEGLASLSFLIGPDAPVGLLPPTPGPELLDAVAVALRMIDDDLRPGGRTTNIAVSSEVIASLASTIGQPGWTIHTARFLTRQVSAETLDDAERTVVMKSATTLFSDLIDACDRVATLDREYHDLVRPERRRLSALLALFGAVGGLDASLCLWRALSSSDPRVGAAAAVVLISNDEHVGEDRLSLIARDPHARAELIGGLSMIGRAQHLPVAFATPVAAAEADLVRWLAEESELGAAPDEIEHLGNLRLEGAEAGDEAQLFRFRVRSPHWSSWRGWMVGAAGPYGVDGRRSSGAEHLVRSLLITEDADTLTGHLRAIESGSAADPA